jgi:hypothetical protein
MAIFHSHIDRIRDQLKGGDLFFPKQLTPYAKTVLKEFDDIEKIYMRVQTDFAPIGLRFGQVILPNLSYEIRPHAGPG